MTGSAEGRYTGGAATPLTGPDIAFGCIVTGGAEGRYTGGAATRLTAPDIAFGCTATGGAEGRYTGGAATRLTAPDIAFGCTATGGAEGRYTGGAVHLAGLLLSIGILYARKSLHAYLRRSITQMRVPRGVTFRPPPVCNVTKSASLWPHSRIRVTPPGAGYSVRVRTTASMRPSIECGVRLTEVARCGVSTAAYDSSRSVQV